MQEDHEQMEKKRKFIEKQAQQVEEAIKKLSEAGNVL